MFIGPFAGQDHFHQVRGQRMARKNVFTRGQHRFQEVHVQKSKAQNKRVCMGLLRFTFFHVDLLEAVLAPGEHIFARHSLPPDLLEVARKDR